jgi:aminobenzoyl-glutamate transport protein
MPKLKQQHFLDWVERTGNRLPDPAVHFLIALLVVWVLSIVLAGVSFSEIDPRTSLPIQIKNQITGPALATFFSRMLGIYTGFPPLGLVLVMVLGVGVAEHSGLFGAALHKMLRFTPRAVLTPALATAALLCHVVADAAILVVVPLGGALFYAAGRHPLAGISVSFAVLVGGFAANVLPSGLDPLLQSFTQNAAQMLDPARTVNPLSNFWFMAAASVPVILVSWWITDKVIEPRLATSPVDGDPAQLPTVHQPTARENRALLLAMIVLVLLAAAVVLWATPADSALRAPDGALGSSQSPLMQALIPMMFVFTVLPSLVFGYAAGTIQNHKDAIKGMSNAVSSMSYYLVLVFFAAMFIFAFSESNIAALLALKGGSLLKSLALPPFVTILGIILLTGTINLTVVSASAKWAMLAPIFVPMLMTAGIAPELTQLAFRVGDGPTNIVTPLMPEFPLLIAFAVRYLKNSGIGTVIALQIPYAIAYLVIVTACLLLYWATGLPLGIEGRYTYP